MVFQDSFDIVTRGRGTYALTREVQQRVERASVRTGICQVFVHHTSASLIHCENADPDVRDDLERFMGGLVPDGDPRYVHTAEGPDDMAAHVRSVLTGSGLNMPVRNGRCDLGNWQGVFLWEHRSHGHRRRVTVTVYGD